MIPLPDPADRPDIARPAAGTATILIVVMALLLSVPAVAADSYANSNNGCKPNRQAYDALVSGPALPSYS